jgi:putative ABC transport system permease protein
MSGAMLGKLANDNRVAFAAPIGFGDSAMGFPIVGTTTALISALSPKLAEGAQFTRLGEAVIGSAVDLPVGARVNPMHGTVETGGHAHSEVSYQVAGKMAPTGTAWDRAILVPIRMVWQLHGMEAHEEHDRADHTEKSGNGFGVLVNEKPHDHDHEIDINAPLDEVFDADSPGVPAILVKPKTIADAYRLRQEYRSDRTLAIFPAEVLTRLYSNAGRCPQSAAGDSGRHPRHCGIRLVAGCGHAYRRAQTPDWRVASTGRAGSIYHGDRLGRAVLPATAWNRPGTGTRLCRRKCHHIMAHGHHGGKMPVEFAMSDVWLAVGFIIVAALVSLIPALMTLRMSAASALRS